MEERKVGVSSKNYAAPWVYAVVTFLHKDIFRKPIRLDWAGQFTKKTMKQKGIIQNKTFDSSIIANQCKDEKFELEKSAIITDEMKEKERNDRNMNSLINVGI